MTGKSIMSTAADSPTVVDLVQRWVKRQPASVAIHDDARLITYDQLWNRAHQVGLALIEKGVQPGEVVGLCASRSGEVFVGMLGILLARAAYLPLDTNLPRPRLHYMLELAGVRCIVGESALIAGIGAPTEALDIAECLTHSRTGSLAPPTPDDLCYVMFTSGSTGAPKGVAHAHAALANLIQWQIGDSRCREQSLTAQYAPLSFDVSFQEVFSTLCAGGTLVCVGEDIRTDPDLLWNFLLSHNINRLFLPAVALQLLAHFADPSSAGRSQLVEIITAGEQLQSGDLLRDLLAALPGCRLINQYGPTETHVVTRHVLAADPATWLDLPPIGTAIDNVRLHILDDVRRPVPDGVAGELYVGGAAVAQGYIGRPDLTAERFIAEVDAPAGSRMYRTGDLVLRNAHRELEFLGRKDAQLKVGGYRVEPGEIEVSLLSFPGVQAGAVVAVGDNPLERMLVAHIVCETAALDEDQLKTYLRSKLPEYMIPSRIRMVASLPFTGSGKIDRRAVAEREQKIDT